MSGGPADGVVRGPADIVAGSIGVFGGTFDPIHFAHLAVAQEAAEALGLASVLFVPAGRPAHKPDRIVTPSVHRLAMVELAIAGNDRFAVGRQELERTGPSYTVDTLAAIRAGRTARGESPELTLILSADAFAGLTMWREPLRILGLARLAVAPRDGYPDANPTFLAEHFPGIVGRVVWLDGPRVRLSASELRRRSAAGRTLRYLVPDAVAAYIDDHALYRKPKRTFAT